MNKYEALSYAVALCPEGEAKEILSVMMRAEAHRMEQTEEQKRIRDAARNNRVAAIRALLAEGVLPMPFQTKDLRAHDTLSHESGTGLAFALKDMVANGELTARKSDKAPFTTYYERV